MKLNKSYYQKADVVFLARNLLGKYLFTKIEGKLCGGIISETEAYEGITDKASHAYGGLRTARTEIMYDKGGCTYVYLCYGIHKLLNIVTNQSDIPHAILIRGIIPETGIEHMQLRCNKQSVKGLTDGPGKVSKALGIEMIHNHLDLTGDIIWVEDLDLDYKQYNIEISKRIGIDYAEEDALLPYRFNLVKK